ncbi:MAG: Hpt domain-containing protein, partial [Campylobacterales bacterium]|nr:Hpt domain-containing protein [Campylobacterales bacterium]
QKDQDIAIVALSANAMKEDVERSHEVGMNGHLNKPIEVEKLFTMFLEYLSPKVAATPHQSPPIQETNLIPHFETINSTKGLGHLAGNQTLYLKLLHNFQNDYRDLDITSLDSESFKLKIHTLKGFSGNIGATKLYEICKNLEEPQGEQYFDAFNTELHRVLDELNSKLPINSLLRHDSKEPISSELKIKLFDELKEAVKLMEPKKCYSIIEQIKHYTLTSKDQKRFSSIIEHIEHYAFDEALELF